MIKYQLICNDCNLIFDSWFASSKEFEKLKKKKLLNCHNCNSLQIEKSLMRPNLANSNFKNDKALSKIPTEMGTISKEAAKILSTMRVIDNNKDKKKKKK